MSHLLLERLSCVLESEGAHEFIVPPNVLESKLLVLRELLCLVRIVVIITVFCWWLW